MTRVLTRFSVFSPLFAMLGICFAMAPLSWADDKLRSCSPKEEADVAAHSVYVNALVTLAKTDVENVERMTTTDAGKEILAKIQKADAQTFVFSSDDETLLRKMAAKKLCADLSREQRLALERNYAGQTGRERVIEQLRLYSALITVSQNMLRTNLMKTQLGQ